MCYAISQAYKESTNCRMEAQYAHQQEKDMVRDLYLLRTSSAPHPHYLHHMNHNMLQVPLMMEDDYKAKGWLGMLLGVRLWYGFHGLVLESEGAFEGKMDELCRELGQRGKT